MGSAKARAVGYIYWVNWFKLAWKKSFTVPLYRLALHTGFWFFLLFFWMRESVVLEITWQQHYSVTLVGIGFALFLFYPLVYGLVPLLQKKQFLLAFLLFIPYYVAAVALRYYHIEQIVAWYNLKNTWVAGRDFWSTLYKNQLDPLKLLETFFSSLTGLLDIIFIPLVIKFSRYAYRVQLKQAWLAQQNTQLQLHTLKAQINPHFFFNTLNNLQSFIVQREQERSVDLLTRLADFMRTSLYDCSGEYIRMQQEMNLLNNYIAIERIRFDDRADIHCTLCDHDPDYLIPPFIFLPFVENVFKHGGSLPTDEVRINIELLNEPATIMLRTTNAYYTADDSTGQKGIGLQNVRRRLAYYFPERYTLTNEQTGTVFRIELRLQK